MTWLVGIHIPIASIGVALGDGDGDGDGDVILLIGLLQLSSMVAIGPIFMIAVGEFMETGAAIHALLSGRPKAAKRLFKTYKIRLILAREIT
ncbi:MAG: hypothetical protein WA790_07400 [Sulfitobacter sp.]